MNDELTLREMLIRMEGKLDLAIAHNERTDDDVKILRGQHHDMNNRIAVIEAIHNQQIGERKGFSLALRAVYALAFVTGLGTVASIAKSLIGQ